MQGSGIRLELLLLLALISCHTFSVRAIEVEQATSSLDIHQNSPEAINKLTLVQANQQIEPQEARVRRRSKSAGLPPSFPTPIGNVTAVLGRDVRLVCTVDNLGSHQVAWLKEETKTIISIDTNIIITNYRIFLIPDEEERKWVLHIKDVQESDRGFYQCQVNTSPMRATSGYLEVVVPPSIIKAQSSQVVETTEHSNVNLQCKAAGHPRPSIVWRRDDGAPIKLTGRQAGSEPPSANNNATSGEPMPAVLSQLIEVKSDRLALFDVDRSMGGIYVCSASNGIPTDASRRIPLYVKFEPKTSVQTKLVSVGLGEPLELECLIEGFPKPASSWSKTSRNKQFREQFASSRWYPTTTTTISGSTIGVGQSSPSLAARVAAQTRSSGEALPAEPKTGPPLNDLFAIHYRNPEESFHQSAAAVAADKDDRRDDLDKQQNYRQNYHQSNPSQLSVFSASHPHNNRIKFKRQLDQLAASASPIEAANRTQKEQLPAEGELGVSLKQTALNPYTYKLELSIARMKLDHYGKYSCIASNQMGASETHVLVTRREKAAREKDDRSSNLQSSDYRSVDDQEYQRDILPEVQASMIRQTSGVTRGNYDENYLQSIRSRQNGMAAGSRSQQRLKSKAKNNSPARIDQIPKLVYLCISLVCVSLGFRNNRWLL